MNIKYLKYTSRSILILITSFWFIFALLSGSGKFGGGLNGILLNSLNAFPWLLLFIIVYIAWKWELLGGILILLFGLFSMFFFKTYINLITFLLISLPLLIISILLIYIWYLNKNDKK